MLFLPFPKVSSMLEIVTFDSVSVKRHNLYIFLDSPETELFSSDLGIYETKYDEY